jgi:hypothetical protein
MLNLGGAADWIYSGTVMMQREDQNQGIPCSYMGGYMYATDEGWYQAQ